MLVSKNHITLQLIPSMRSDGSAVKLRYNVEVCADSYHHAREWIGVQTEDCHSSNHKHIISLSHLYVEKV